MEISSFYKSESKIMIIRYTVPEIWRVPDEFINIYFGLFFNPFAPTLPNSPKIQKFWKNEKKQLEEHSLKWDQCRDLQISF